MNQYSILISFVLTAFFLVLLLKTSLSELVLDHPNARSLHSKKIPRTGGLAIILSVLTAWCFVHIDIRWFLLIIPLIAVSFMDDLSGLSVRWRFLVQIIVAGIFVYFNYPDKAWWVILLIPTLVWMMNLYNFMDGSDGLAGGMAVFGFATYAFAAYWQQTNEIAQMSSIVAASSCAFLMFNFHPAKIFMGDAGSIPLGFLAGAIGVAGWQQDAWPFWFPVLVFSPFIMDATVTLLKRALRGEKVWQAHREHYYQRLVQMGWGHRNTALAAYCLMLASSVTAFLMLKLPNMITHIICILWILVYLILMTLIDAKWKRFQLNR